jgi:thymidine phosphorylase
VRVNTFLPQEFIRKVRNGDTAAPNDIREFIAGIGEGIVSDAQVAAFAMAIYFNDFDIQERVVLTEAMRDSGDVMNWHRLDGPVLDKHSTGGVGDNVSLLLAPVIAACGGYVPMISGPGLGHTGGTLDKFDSIPGYNTVPSNDVFRQTVKDIGCAIIGQTGNLAPADKKIYAIRSATATVKSISLITASILSKKLAAGLEGLVLDIKCGNGAVMTDVAAAKKLARSLVDVANGAGVKTSGLITDMNEPLASAAGNAVEMQNAIDHLTGVHRDARLHDVVVELSAEMLMHGGLATSLTQARDQINQVFENGKAAEKFAKMVSALGGPSNLLENPAIHLPKAPLISDITAENAGIVSAIDARKIGLAVIVLGGGRKQPDDKIDYGVGFDRLTAIGTKIEKGDVIARIHANTEDERKEGAKMLNSAYTLGDKAPDNPLIITRISPE